MNEHKFSQLSPIHKEWLQTNINLAALHLMLASDNAERNDARRAFHLYRYGYITGATEAVLESWFGGDPSIKDLIMFRRLDIEIQQRHALEAPPIEELYA